MSEDWYGDLMHQEDFLGWDTSAKPFRLRYREPFDPVASHAKTLWTGAFMDCLFEKREYAIVKR